MPSQSIEHSREPERRAWTDADIEQAWRNGWGSAMVMLRGADKLVEDAQARKMLDGGLTHRVVRRMVSQWVDLIDELIDDVLDTCRGRLAELPEADASGQSQEAPDA